jgi:putative ABC transport system permease protein
VKALQRKLVRDLWDLAGQVVTIALVVMCGVASFVTMRSAFDSLVSSRDAYYERYRFADVFAHLERAPESVADRVRSIPGVAIAETRVLRSVMIPISGLDRPAVGTLLSLPNDGTPALDAVALKRGRMLDATHDDEVLVLDGFANAHGLEPGDRLPVVLNGVQRDLRVVGIAMSPEFVFPLAPGAITYDAKTSAVLWMSRSAVAAAFRMEGAFDDIVIRLEPGASSRNVELATEAVLTPYGVVSVLPRAKQISNYILSGELMQLENMATVVPFIFLFVAAFLLNVVLSRLVYLQRSQIATLKAVGYSDLHVGLHYLSLVLIVVVIGSILGIGVGAWLGRSLTHLYTDQYFRFADPHFRVEPASAVLAILVSLISACVGALSAVRHVTRLPPAEAMRPPSPTSYRQSWWDRIGGSRLFGPSTRMVLREVGRRPLRLVLSTVGIALASGIVVVAGFFYDAIGLMLDVQFHRAMREDVTVTFQRTLPRRAVREMAHLPGVVRAEGLRNVPVRMRHGHHFRDAVLVGHEPGAGLRRVQDGRANPAVVPEDGVMLTSMLAEVLDVRPGDEVDVELRAGTHEKTRIRVSALVDEPFGLQGHMSARSLARISKEEEAVDGCVMLVERDAEPALYRRLRSLPWVASVDSPRTLREQFDTQNADVMRVYTLVLTLFACIIASGVVYNNARVALSQKSRDLASLRVLGFTRGEISRVLLGELSLQVLLALPLGALFGYWMVLALAHNTDPEIFRLPIWISPRTYAFAMSVTLAAATLSALFVRRQVDRLDLIGVLKTRE